MDNGFATSSGACMCFHHRCFFFSFFSLLIFQNKVVTSSFGSNILKAFLSLLNPLLIP